MNAPQLLDELGSKLSRLMASTPAAEVEKNVRALVGAAFSRLDLVTREEFDVQREMLLRLRERLNQLEARVAELEARRDGVSPAE